MRLKEALGVRPSEMVSFIGAAGKTTTLFALAKELRDEGGKVLLTTTTKILKPTKPHVDRLFLIEDINAFPAEILKITAPAIIAAGYQIDQEGKLVGLPAPWIDELEKRALFNSLLVEADAAASRLFKVPSEIEPVVPPNCHLVVWLMAIKVLGKPLDGVHVHRAERAASLLGVAPGTILTGEHILRLIKHPEGSLKGVPTLSRRVALITHADSPDEIEMGKQLARNLLPLGFERVVIASYLKENSVEQVMVR
jgi:probable selenium-dependent hydroxylase accessory protein YqeC